MNMKGYFLFCMLLFPFTVFADSAITSPSTSHPVVLPVAIQQQLDQNFPGWHWPPSKPGYPDFIVGDFDRNNLKDAAMNIIVGPSESAEEVLVVFLQHEDGYEQKILESRGVDPRISLKLLKRSVHEQDSQTGVRKFFQREFFEVRGSPEGDHGYAFEDGQFEETDSN